jgi:hypothetical protein
MKLQCWIRTFFAMLFAALAFFAPSAIAETSTATFVREVTLSPGNWLWDHYVRMSPEYRSAHPYKQFLESEVCYLKDRKCTEEDWKHVPKTQTIYIPAEPLLVRVPANEPIPVITLEGAGTGDFELFAPLVDAKGLSGFDADVLATELAIQKAMNTALSSEYVSQVTFFKNAVALLIFLAIALALSVLFLWSRLSRSKQELKNATSCFRGYPEPDTSPTP